MINRIEVQYIEVMRYYMKDPEYHVGGFFDCQAWSTRWYLKELQGGELLNRLRPQMCSPLWDCTIPNPIVDLTLADSSLWTATDHGQTELGSRFRSSFVLHFEEEDATWLWWWRDVTITFAHQNLLTHLMWRDVKWHAVPWCSSYMPPVPGATMQHSAAHSSGVVDTIRKSCHTVKPAFATCIDFTTSRKTQDL